MKKDKPSNLAASVRQRLMNLARAQKEDFQLVLTRYALERLLYRLTQSKHAGVFVLKGAMLFQLWSHQPHRPTRDLDLLGRGESSIERFEQIFRDICQVAVEDDALAFLADTVHGERIREDQEYEGLRITFEARLENARIPIQIDIGFGDAVTPAAAKIQYPTMLGFPAPTLKAYRQPTVVAEKFQAMVALGIANSRMKDFYDLWILARDFEFDGRTLCQAIQATFRRRKTALPSQPPLALTAEFFGDRAKMTQWQAFLRKGKLDAGGISLEQVAAVLRDFLMPPTSALVADQSFEMTWPRSGPWAPATAKE